MKLMINIFDKIYDEHKVKFMITFASNLLCTGLSFHDRYLILTSQTPLNFNAVRDQSCVMYFIIRKFSTFIDDGSHKDSRKFYSVVSSIKFPYLAPLSSFLWASRNSGISKDKIRTYSATNSKGVHFDWSAFGIHFLFIGVSKVTLKNKGHGK